MIVIKALDQGNVISLISFYGPQYGLDDIHTDDLYDSLIGAG